MIREAAEKGYDRLSWTPGEAQAARYDLSKQVDNIKVKKADNGQFEVGTTLKGGLFQDMGIHSKEKLADIVGKDLAEKIINQSEKSKTYSGIDLKVGGEGMKGFYDQIIPKSLEKIGKEHGVKVKQGTIAAAMKKMGDSGEQPIHYIDLPQSLKDQAMHKGFPLFSKGGFMLQPVNHEPDFGDK